MYVVTRTLKPVSAEELVRFEQQHSVSLPVSYRQWLEQYGEGTYSGWMNVQRPDHEVLKPFAEYDFWMHTDDTPVSQQQLEDCISIGSSVDGDFLAIHPEIDGLLWLPRHDEQITLWKHTESEFGDTLDRIYCGYYGQAETIKPSYFEPWNELRNHTFYHLEDHEDGMSIQHLASLCQAQFKWDAVMESEYTCKLFMASIGGYLRFNYANGREIALFYEEIHGVEGTTDYDIEQFLLAHHCRIMN
ncbi:SMI1/KNR4 family protein [Paenibacillus xylanilyticus]|uniref:SMI1/KNR4 family protein n=1 Tax=Paenibacillus xylanilyticus TaxID=248903 RepID=UPI0039A1D75F